MEHSIDREKVIKGLECIAQKREPTANPCKDCGYIDRPNYAICVKDIASDAIVLLNEQEQRINELEEKLRLMEYGDQGILQSGMMSAT